LAPVRGALVLPKIVVVDLLNSIALSINTHGRTLKWITEDLCISVGKNRKMVSIIVHQSLYSPCYMYATIL